MILLDFQDWERKGKPELQGARGDEHPCAHSRQVRDWVGTASKLIRMGLLFHVRDPDGRKHEWGITERGRIVASLFADELRELAGRFNEPPPKPKRRKAS